MKNLLYISLVASIAYICLSTTSCTAPKKQELFYYGTNEKIPLQQRDSKVIVKFSSKTESNNKSRRLEQYGEIERIDDQVFFITMKDSSNTKRTIQTLKKEDDIISVNPIYLTPDNQEMGVTDEICFEFSDEMSDEDKKEFLEEFKTEELIRTQAWEKYYTVVTVTKDQNALEIANKIKESGKVKFSHPNFYARTVKHAFFPNDEYFGNQFYLHNTGQATNDGNSGTADSDIDAPEAWDISTGANTITVAVLDEGVERTNNDLPAGRLTIINGSNFAGGNANDPDAAGDGAHGTCCAGIIAASQHNTEGVSGIAPLCNIMPVRIPFGTIPSSTYANAINFAWSNGADVLSNSWGYSSTANIPVITSAISNAITNGRGGTGSVVVWSAGNTANHASSNTGFVSFPGNAAVTNLLTVGASNRNDQQANYSPDGPGVDVVAPSHHAYSCQIAGESFEVWSTDIIGAAGYNSTKNTDCGTLPVVAALLPAAGTNFRDYTGRMGGTSASCPEAAGVAALILSVNPTFTPAQVFNIITNSADEVGGYTYASGVSTEMGNGRLNAFNALSDQLWMKDTANDPGTEPNPTSDPMYLSDDVWVRQTNDGLLVHQDAEYKTSSPNSVYVRVRNAGALAGNATLKLYWAKASSGLGWEAPWDGTVTSPALMGGIIGSKATGVVPAFGEAIVQFDWFPPDPALYASFGTDQFHFCLLARIETETSPPYGMTIPETSSLWNNVKNNNNIVWKNMAVRDNVSGNAGISGMLVANYSRTPELTRVVFNTPDLDKKFPMLRYGELTVTLSEQFYRKWKESGAKGEGIEAEDNKIKITSPNAWIGDFVLKQNEIYGLEIMYKMANTPEVDNLKEFAFYFDVDQQIQREDDWETIGGQRIQYYPLKREDQ